MKKPIDLTPRIGKHDFSLYDMATIYDETDGKPDKPHRHTYYTVLLVNKAIGQHIIDFQSYPFEDGQLYFISPGQVHQVITTEKPEGSVITFTEDFLLENNISSSFISNLNLFSSYGETPPLHVEEFTIKKLNTIIEDMRTCLTTTHQYKMNALGALLQLFLIHTNNSPSVTPTINDEENSAICLLRDFKSLLSDKYSSWHKVSDYASHIHITPKHLSSVIKSLTGRTAKEMIQDRLHLEAKRLLLHTSLTIKEIGFRLGYDEPLHFSAFFKKAEGESPTTFRQSHSVLG